MQSIIDRDDLINKHFIVSTVRIFPFSHRRLFPVLEARHGDPRQDGGRKDKQDP